MGATLEETQARAFWWDRARPADAHVDQLRAVLFDLDGALADIERDGHRVAFNAAFAAHGLDIEWDVREYGRLLRIRDERRRIASALRGQGFGADAGALAAQVHRTKTSVFEGCLLDGDVAPRPGLVDLVMSLFVAGVWVGVVSTGRRTWAEPLARQLIGDGIAETIVTIDDVPDTHIHPDLHGIALWEMGLAPESALAIAGSVRGLRAARDAKLATVVVTTGYSAEQDFTGAVAVRPGYDGAAPLLAAGCERLHRRWWAAR
ncbi:HAD family hydrolase [Mycobacterium sp.]|uniref:HAD family hydrolase n=1 Tax=Mycobacterium sp. TaxID=1785 RepID=UPI002D2585C6|nr:HAD family hydrolase [Mycobacterium sp.]HZA08719.1 HAD family hydrolase [Mycobacterium sp.]